MNTAMTDVCRREEERNARLHRLPGASRGRPFPPSLPPSLPPAQSAGIVDFTLSWLEAHGAPPEVHQLLDSREYEDACSGKEGGSEGGRERGKEGSSVPSLPLLVSSLERHMTPPTSPPPLPSFLPPSLPGPIICLLAALPHLLDTGKSGREAYLTTLLEVAKKNRKGPFR